jgi:cell pole-organizing protein PopZ
VALNEEELMSDRNEISNNSGPGSSAEPSMEEILASIRRILKNDEAKVQAPDEEDDDVLVLRTGMIASPADISSATAMPDPLPLPSRQEPLDFAPAPAIDSYFTPEPLRSIFSPPPEPATEPEPVLELAPAPMPAPNPLHDPVPEPPADAFHTHAYTPPPETMQMPTAPEEEETVSNEVQAPDGLIGSEAAADVAHSIGALISSISHERAISVSRGGITIEDIVREEIRPVLKAWFDTHLPSLVERIVRAEVARVIDRTQV